MAESRRAPVTPAQARPAGGRARAQSRAAGGAMPTGCWRQAAGWAGFSGAGRRDIQGPPAPANERADTAPALPGQHSFSF